MESAREHWTSHTGFVLATIGGAVGIGNIWRFSYVAGENGGAAFLVVYLAAVVLIGVPLMIAELAIGRHAQGDAISAYQAGRPNSGWQVVGWLGVLAAPLILSYYAVIAGWVLHYLAGSITGALWEAADRDYGGYFSRFIAGGVAPIAWQALMLLIAALVVARGIQRGIERANRLMIPGLAIIVVLLAGYALTLPGSRAGVGFLFEPDWSALAEPRVYAAALGQTFFSLGVGMAFFVTYGSYMPRTFSIPASAATIAVGDTLFALLAGLAIFPAVFAFGGNPAAGPELAFITLPQVFLDMPAGRLVGLVFFVLLAMAALTSMVALLEIPVAALTPRLRRPVAVACVATAVFVAGLPSALSYGVLAWVRIGARGILDAIDNGVSSFLLPAIGIGTALYVGWRLERAFALTEADLGGSRFGTAWLWLIRLVVPLTILLILLQAVGLL